jgi:cytochrome d ubiquinol oxidase subunit II
MSFYQIIWFFLVGILLTVFAILDGFDFGVGIWYLRAKGDKKRRTLLNSIGPFWDGNEVWLLTGGGALFAAFPPVYATVFSGFYLAMMLVIMVLIFRAVSLEFRSQEQSKRWRSTWDVAFSVASMLAAILFGVAFGNILRGIPLDDARNFAGNFFTLLNPYALMVGVLALVALAFHGAIYAMLKTAGALGAQAKGWVSLSGPVYLVLSIIAIGVTVATQPHLVENYSRLPLLWIIPVLAITFIAAAMRYAKKDRHGLAFLFSSLSIAGLMAGGGAGLFPRLVPALGNLELSMTAGNASSSPLTLKIMFIMAVIGVPIVAGYTIWVYKMFWGKVDVDHESSHY